MNKTRELVLISLLAVIIALSGSFKVPSPFMGSEFQLSAPIAVAIAACFGFKRYFLAGIIASAVCMLLGTQNIINVIVAMTFRVVAGGIIHLFKGNIVAIILSGPTGSIAARVVLWIFFKKAIMVMLIAGFPGMLYTAILSYPLTKLLNRVRKVIPWSELSYGKNSL
ncbi:hypothetical protein [Clostridium oceanicum]|uniref:QueT transporter family protein n=1 Tax=Clostridium oceanicum TaxID=1543 RepID=A0ABP3UJR2_9CLOT